MGDEHTHATGSSSSLGRANQAAHGDLSDLCDDEDIDGEPLSSDEEALLDQEVFDIVDGAPVAPRPPIATASAASISKTGTPTEAHCRSTPKSSSGGNSGLEAGHAAGRRNGSDRAPIPFAD